MQGIDPVFRVVSPCPRRWDEMQGSDQRRYCESCRLQVHNLSAMTVAEREAFKRGLSGPACVTYEVLPDGSMAGPRRFEKVRKWLRLAAAAVAVVVPFFGTGCAASTPTTTGGLRLPARRSDRKEKCPPTSATAAAEVEPARVIVTGGI